MTSAFGPPYLTWVILCSPHSVNRHRSSISFVSDTAIEALRWGWRWGTHRETHPPLNSSQASGENGLLLKLEYKL